MSSQEEVEDAKSRWVSDPITRVHAKNLEAVIKMDIAELVAAASVSGDPQVRQLAAYYGRDVAFLRLLQGGDK